VNLPIKIAEKVRDKGGRAFLVGGAVRDGLLGLDPTDLDFEIFGLEESSLAEILRDFGSVNLIGRHFAVFHVATAEQEIQVSLPRREVKTGPGHKGFSITADPGMDPSKASARRDFTVNALMEDPLSGEILDFWEGRKDLKAGLLRHVSPAFAEDPLRVLRVSRFVSRFDWAVHPETAAFCRELDLSEIPRERIEEEWKKILVTGNYPGSGVRVMEETGALEAFPEIDALRGVPQDPEWHPEGDVFIHTCLALDAATKVRTGVAEQDWIESLGVLCHDFGKPAFTVEKDGRWRSPGHDVGGVEVTRDFLARVTAQSSIVDSVVALVREHLRPTQLWQARAEVSDAAIRRLALRLDQTSSVDIPSLLRVAWSDAAGRGEPMPEFEQWDPAQWLLERAGSLGVREEYIRNFLQGKDLLELGITPGPKVGEILDEILELQIEGTIADRESAIAWAKERLGQER